MRVRNNLALLMGKHKIRSVNMLSKATGVSTPTLYRLYDESNERIDYNTIVLLCDYFKCDIGDLIYLERDNVEEEGK